MAGNLGFLCRSFGGGAFSAISGIIVTLAAPHVINSIKNRMEAIREEQKPIETVDPDLC